MKFSSAYENVARSAPVTLRIPVCNDVTHLCPSMGKGTNILAVEWFCVFSGSVLVVFSHLPKGKGKVSEKLVFCQWGSDLCMH